MALLKHLKYRVTILYCLKQAENGKGESLVVNAAQPLLPNSVTKSVLFPGKNLTGRSKKLTGREANVRKCTMWET